MFKSSVFTVVFVLIAVFGSYCAPAVEEPTPEPIETPEPQAITATADLQATEGNEVSGTVSFEEADGMVTIVADVTGLEPGLHGFHIHETGDCSAPDGTSAGGHFNPGETEHGAPDAEMHHSGDLGNLEADEMGAAHLEVSVDFITLSEGPASVLNRGVIVHAMEDDFGQPTGNAGARLACGVIQ
jgi:Cu-Zn family superoxide dismutase